MKIATRNVQQPHNRAPPHTAIRPARNTHTVIHQLLLLKRLHAHKTPCKNNEPSHCRHRTSLTNGPPKPVFMRNYPTHTHTHGYRCQPQRRPHPRRHGSQHVRLHRERVHFARVAARQQRRGAVHQHPLVVLLVQILQQPRRPEVCQLHRPVRRHQCIGRLEIPVHPRRRQLVQKLHPARNVRRKPQPPLHRHHHRRVVQNIPQTPPAAQLRHEKRQPIVPCPSTVEEDDVGMSQLAQQSDLTLKLVRVLLQIPLLHRFANHFDRHRKVLIHPDGNFSVCAFGYLFLYLDLGWIDQPSSLQLCQLLISKLKEFLVPTAANVV
eukprot:m.738405 g.738405  ORF g.738405 m.738405 type:complete len:322 (+) comp23099_c0_seq13:195-1160(+)